MTTDADRLEAPKWRAVDCDHGQTADVHRAGWGTIAHCGSTQDAQAIASALNEAASHAHLLAAAREWKRAYNADLDREWPSTTLRRERVAAEDALLAALSADDKEAT